MVGIEASATSHHRAREIEALGHRVRSMAPRYVKAYVRRNKNDMADAQAICEAVSRPTMRFVEIKTPAQQSVLMLHRTRHLFVRQRTMLINALRAHLAEFGIVALVGRRRALRDPAGQASGVLRQTVAHRASGTPINEDRRHHSGQQDRPHGLGDDGAWHTLRGATGGLKHARARLALTRLERAADAIMHPAGRPEDQDTPLSPVQHSDCVLMTGT